MKNYWKLGPEPYADAHFATFPTEIPRRAILAGTSAHGVCGACGAPWRRVTENVDPRHWTERRRTSETARRWADGSGGGHAGTEFQRAFTAEHGWSPTCAHDAPVVPALVLDPFAGSGTTLMVALRHGRRALGFDLSPAYVEMARRRITGDAPLLNGTAPVEVEEEPAQLGLWQEPPG